MQNKNSNAKYIIYALPILTAITTLSLIKEIEISIILTLITTIFATLIVLQAKHASYNYNYDYAANIKAALLLYNNTRTLMPWHKKQVTLVIGPEKSGKSLLLKENGTEKLNCDEIHDVGLGSWWQHTKSGLVLEVDTNEEFLPKDNKEVFWKNIIESMHSSLLFATNLKNVIITIPATLLHHNNSTTFNKSLENIQQLLQIISAHAPQAKVNIVMTHCDKILGFQSFFYDLGQDEREQLLAIFKNSNNCKMTLKSIVKTTLPEIILSISQHALKRLRQEHDPLKKFEIKDFPLQLEGLIDPINTLIKQLEIILPKQIYGIYFCCNSLSNTSFDYIHKKTPPKVANTQVSILGANDNIKGYFNSNIISQINCLKIKMKYSKKDLVIIGVMSLFCLTSIYVCLNMYASYISTGSITEQVQKMITNKNNDNESSELDKLYMAWEYVNKTGSKEAGNSQAEELKQHLSKHYKSYVKTEIQGLINTNVNNNINEEINHNQNFYQSMINIKSLNGNDITTNEQQYIKNLLSNNKKHKHLIQHIESYANDNKIDIRMDPKIMLEINTKMKGITLAEKAMMMIPKTTTKAISIGFPDETLLNPESINYTIARSIPNSCKLLQQAHELGSISYNNCISITHQHYKKQYRNYWHNKFNMQHLATNETSLIDINNYIRYIQDNHSQLSVQITTTNRALAAINDNVRISENNSWKQLIENNEFNSLLNDIAELTNNISKSSSEMAAYEEISLQEINPAESVISKINEFSQTLSIRQQNWLLNIGSSLNVITTDIAYKYLNNIWQNTVMAIFEKKLAGKFPLNKDSKNEIDFSDFEQFFGPNGILATYLNLIEPIHNNKALVSHLTSTNLKAFTTTDKIINSWFDKYKKPRLYMTFIPVELEKNANKFTLEIGNKKLELSKNNDKTNEFIWPEHGDNITTIEFENTLGQSSIKNKNSPWSLIQLFNESDIEVNNNEKDFLITFKLDSFRAKYHMMLKNSFDIKSYGGIAGFDLSKQL
ncbi:MAG: hypothetical protein HON78_00425 [Legionellales bacterium]|jgi:hypothetical protein|nr:hypothetical protein [Legionellales bacterium]